MTETLDMTFTIYSDGNGQSALYTQEARVYVENGLFSVILGEIPVEVFAEHAQAYIGVRIGNNPEMRPLQQLASAAYAYKAEVASYAESAGNVMGEIMVDSASKVGIGTASPSEKLEVAGNIKASGDISAVNIYEGSARLVDKYLGSGAQAVDADRVDGYHTTTEAAAQNAIPVIRPDVTYHNLRAGYAGTADTLGNLQPGQLMRNDSDNTMRGKLTVTDATGGNTIGLDADNQEVKVGSNKVWHEGNMGAGSGLNADLLDGYDSSTFTAIKGCYVSYSGGCLSGFTNMGSAGSWGLCYSYHNDYGSFFRPAGGGCPSGVYPGSSYWTSEDLGTAYVCCQ